MSIIFIGILLLIGGFILAAAKEPALSKRAGLLKLIGILLIPLGLLTSCIIQIGSGDIGVKVLFGKVQSDVLTSGIHLVNPLMEIIHFDSRTQNYTMSAVHDEGDKAGDDAIRVLSSDGLEVVIDLTVLLRIIPEKAPMILKEMGKDYKNIVVRPVTRTKIRDNAAYYDAVSLYSTKRDEFQKRIFDALEKQFLERGLVLEQLLVRNITLPVSVKQAIESKINAEQESQKMKFVLEKEKQEADRKRVEAQGIADYQKILNTGLTPQQLQYEMIKAQKEIATSPNTKVIILGGDGKHLPFMMN